MRAEMQEAIAGNLTMEELIRINEPWCGTEILRRLRNDEELVTDIIGYWTDGEHDAACEDAFENGAAAGRDAMDLLGEISDHLDSGSKSIEQFHKKIRETVG